MQLVTNDEQMTTQLNVNSLMNPDYDRKSHKISMGLEETGLLSDEDAGDLTQPERFVTSCHTQGMVKNHGVSQTTAPGLIPSSAGDRQSDTGVNTKIGHNRSSLLVLSSSKEDEDDRVYS